MEIILFTLCLILTAIIAVLYIKFTTSLKLRLEEKNNKIKLLEEQNNELSSYKGRFEEALNTISYLKSQNKENIQKIEILNNQIALSQKEKELFKQQQEHLQKEKNEWGKEKEVILHKLAKELIEQHNQSQSDFSKNNKEEIKKTTENLYKNFEEVLNKVSSLNDDVKKNYDTINLTKNALLNPGGAGQTSEITLENILKSSGLKERDKKGIGDYMLQSHFCGIDGVGKKPDAVIWLPHNHIMIIDSKSSSHFLELQQAIENSDYEAEKKLMSKIKERMRQHIEDLKKRDYAKNKLEELNLKENDKETIITTIMFLQTEKMLEIVNKADEKLAQKALESGIQITSISGLINSLNDAKRRIDYFKQEKNIEDIKKIIKNIIDSIHRMAEKSAAIGKSIKNSANKYDDFIASMGRMLSNAKKVNEMGIESNQKNLEIRLEKINVNDETKIIDQTPYIVEIENKKAEAE